MKANAALKQLLEAGVHTNRTSWAFAAKKQGIKVIGILSEYVPEEVIHAAGMLPWRVAGKSSIEVTYAEAYRQMDSCLYCNHVLEMLLRGELDFLDGVVATDADQDLLRLWDVWSSLEKTPFTWILHVPRNDTELCYHWFRNELQRLAGALEAFGGAPLTRDNLAYSIKVYNQTRDLLGRLYELRKGDTPPLSGYQIAKIVASATVMPKEEYNQLLEKVVGWSESTKSIKIPTPVRLLVSSDLLYELDYIAIVEEEGCLVVMDDLDMGARYLWGQIEDNTDPLGCLARRYLSLPTCSRMFFWNRQAKQIVNWVREFNVHGVLELVQMYSKAREMRSPFLAKCLRREGIPFLSLTRDYCLSNIGQFKTRVGAFLEILQGQIEDFGKGRIRK